MEQLTCKQCAHCYVLTKGIDRGISIPYTTVYHCMRKEKDLTDITQGCFYYHERKKEIDDIPHNPNAKSTGLLDYKGNDSFEVVDDINDDYKNYRRISLKISGGDCQLKTILRKYANSNEYLVGIEGKFKQKEIKIPSSRQITVGEFNTLLDIVKLDKFKINEQNN